MRRDGSSGRRSRERRRRRRWRRGRARRRRRDRPRSRRSPSRSRPRGSCRAHLRGASRSVIVCGVKRVSGMRGSSAVPKARKTLPLAAAWNGAARPTQLAAPIMWRESTWARWFTPVVAGDGEVDRLAALGGQRAQHGLRELDRGRRRRRRAGRSAAPPGPGGSRRARNRAARARFARARRRAGRPCSWADRSAARARRAWSAGPAPIRGQAAARHARWPAIRSGGFARLDSARGTHVSYRGI